jgi:hypothetical protein
MRRTARLKTLAELSTPQAKLQGICEVATQEKDTERGRELVEWLKEFVNAPSLDAMLRDNRGLMQELEHTHRSVADYSKKHVVHRSYRDYPHDIIDPHSFALWVFGNLIDNELNEKFRGPCARCGIYFPKKRATQNVYCSRRCGNAATAVARTRERIDEERNDKLLRAKGALREWRSAATKEDWKHWVAKRAKIDLRFITRAVNKGDLVPPQKGK